MSLKSIFSKFFPIYKSIGCKSTIIRVYLCGVACIYGCSSQRLAVHNSNATGSDNKLDIYLLIGQSNMAGRAIVEQSQRDSLKNVYLFTGDGWEPAANPLNKYSTVRKALSIQQLGPGYSFAKKLEQYMGRKIGLVVNARGGTRIQWWEKGYTGKSDFDLYEQTVLQVKKALEYGELKGIIWHQGEGNQSHAERYMAQLKRLVNDLRKDLEAKDVLFVAGEIGKWRSSSIKINNVIRSIPHKMKHAAYAAADSLTPLKGDSSNPHFDTRSQLILGKRYADEVLKQVYHLKPGRN